MKQTSQSHKQKILNKIAIFSLFTILFLIASIESKCINSTEFRYQLKQITQIQGYNALCNQFTRRTCCSSKNVDVLARKISKNIFTGVDQLSLPCRFKLTNMMCSYCDGDIGQGKLNGICKNYCMQLYQSCKDDYFLVDTNGKLRVCKQDDIVCTQLSYIVNNNFNTKQSICELFGYSQGYDSNCWDGKSSADLKGAAKKKIKYFYKRVIPGQEQKPLYDKQKLQTYAIYAMGAVFLGLVIWKWGKSRVVLKKKHYHKLN